MIIKTPVKLEGYFRAYIIRRLKVLNPRFDYPNTASWQTVKPTLEESISREVIEIELKNLDLAWQRCHKLTKNGASKIHLVLHPKLYEEAKKAKPNFITENPTAKLEIYSLPQKKTQYRKAPVKKKEKQIITPRSTKKAEPIEDFEDELPEDTDLEQYWATKKPKPLEEINVSLQKGITCSTCDMLIQEENRADPVCQKYPWEIAVNLTERDAVCEE